MRKFLLSRYKIKFKFVNLVAVAELPAFCVVGDWVPDHGIEKLSRGNLVKAGISEWIRGETHKI